MINLKIPNLTLKRLFSSEKKKQSGGSEIAFWKKISAPPPLFIRDLGVSETIGFCMKGALSRKASPKKP